ncbi:translation initiation factor IF-2 [Mycoemilia scoparia]|uniref:Translation initiation factor IF-2, mitochondrial n=1 Tax=Mycoemilia scoparia TaxID=417184 RepID=A0A9W8A2U4_9FUNG|nr:translation initiation factor IF-2 [Mycoemilia scoparia]
MLWIKRGIRPTLNSKHITQFRRQLPASIWYRSYTTPTDNGARKNKLLELLKANKEAESWKPPPPPEPPRITPRPNTSQRQRKGGGKLLGNMRNRSKNPRQSNSSTSFLDVSFGEIEKIISTTTKTIKPNNTRNRNDPKRSTTKPTASEKEKDNKVEANGLPMSTQTMVIPMEAGDNYEYEAKHGNDRYIKFKKQSKSIEVEKRERSLPKPEWQVSKRAQQRLESDEGYVNDPTPRRKPKKTPKAGKEVNVPLAITVDDLAKLIGVRYKDLIEKMESMGLDKLANDYVLTPDEASNIVLEYDMVPVLPSEAEFDIKPRPIPEDMSIHPLRPPIVTIMGHVDHGKTTLLDTLRNSKIAAGEAGGITQHIGAFSVNMSEKSRITFLDTPGHYVYEGMRERGAKVTDIVVLVVAADDGVMPQTAEAIRHALAADVPIIVAINKCDKPGADPSKVKEGLLQYGVQVEEMGGDVQAVEISALKQTGVDELKESIMVLAEVLDLRAELDIPAEATVIESQIEKGRGNVASVLVRRGTLQSGSVIVSGNTWCKVRSMMDDRGKVVSKALPGDAVKILGWKDLPISGDSVLQADNEAHAKKVVDSRLVLSKRLAALEEIEAINNKRKFHHENEELERQQIQAFKKAVWEFHKGIRKVYPEPPECMKETGNFPPQHATEGGDNQDPDGPKTMSIILKADVTGTIEAVREAVQKLPNKKVQVNVIGHGVGQIVESDILLAKSASSCTVIGFNVKVDKKTQSLAKVEKIKIKTYKIIYKLLDELKEMMTEYLDPVYEDVTNGEARVQQIFDINIKGSQSVKIAGCRVLTGTILKENEVRIVRNDMIVYEGKIDTFKKLKNDASEASKGQECGLSFVDFEDTREGDIIRSIIKKAIPQTIE